MFLSPFGHRSFSRAPDALANHALALPEARAAAPLPRRKSRSCDPTDVNL
jgi:hypothetical protein